MIFRFVILIYEFCVVFLLMIFIKKGGVFFKKKKLLFLIYLILINNLRNSVSLNILNIFKLLKFWFKIIGCWSIFLIFYIFK